ncbi:MAG: hypothetical protein NC098_04740 [Lachnoclostridium sp.]|nr:hypothetical protein [Lachnoclostridium sp.]
MMYDSNDTLRASGGGVAPIRPDTPSPSTPLDGRSRVTFVNCKGFYTYFVRPGETALKLNEITENSWTVTLRQPTISLYDAAGKEICKFDPATTRKIGYFTLEQSGEYDWTVENTETLFDEIKDKVVAWVGKNPLLIPAAILIFLIGLAIGFTSNKETVKTEYVTEKIVVHDTIYIEQDEPARKVDIRLVDEYNRLLARLNRMDVMATDVAAIEAFAAEPSKELAKVIAENRAKVNAYKKFFDQEDAPTSDEAKKYFTKEQQNAYKYYNQYYNLHKKNDPKRDFNYAKRKLEEMGLY